MIAILAIRVHPQKNYPFFFAFLWLRMCTHWKLEWPSGGGCKEAASPGQKHNMNLNTFLNLNTFCLNFQPIQEPIYIVTELMNRGSLLDFLREGDGRNMTLKPLLDIAAQVSSCRHADMNGLKKLTSGDVTSSSQVT